MQLACGWEVPFMGRRLERERPEHRAAFADRGFAVRRREFCGFFPL